MYQKALGIHRKVKDIVTRNQGHCDQMGREIAALAHDPDLLEMAKDPLPPEERRVLKQRPIDPDMQKAVAAALAACGGEGSNLQLAFQAMAAVEQLKPARARPSRKPALLHPGDLLPAP
jgi:hypothetical protein